MEAYVCKKSGGYFWECSEIDRSKFSSACCFSLKACETALVIPGEDLEKQLKEEIRSLRRCEKNIKVVIK